MTTLLSTRLELYSEISFQLHKFVQQAFWKRSREYSLKTNDVLVHCAVSVKSGTMRSSSFGVKKMFAPGPALRWNFFPFSGVELSASRKTNKSRLLLVIAPCSNHIGRVIPECVWSLQNGHLYVQMTFCTPRVLEPSVGGAIEATSVFRKQSEQKLLPVSLMHPHITGKVGYLA